MRAIILKEIHRIERKPRVSLGGHKPQIRICAIRLLARRRINYAAFYSRLYANGTHKGGLETPRSGMAQRPDAPRKEVYPPLSRDARMDGFNSFRATVCAIRIRRAQSHSNEIAAQRRAQFTYQDAHALRKMLQGIRMRFFDKNQIKP